MSCVYFYMLSRLTLGSTFFAEVGILQPNQVPVDLLRAGEVGSMCGSIKDV